MVFKKIERFFRLVEDLSILTITSKAMRNLVEGYCSLHPVLKRELISKLHVQSQFLPPSVEKQNIDYIGCFSSLGNHLFCNLNGPKQI